MWLLHLCAEEQRRRHPKKPQVAPTGPWRLEVAGVSGRVVVSNDEQLQALVKAAYCTTPTPGERPEIKLFWMKHGQ